MRLPLDSLMRWLWAEQEACVTSRADMAIGIESAVEAPEMVMYDSLEEGVLVDSIAEDRY